MSTARVILAVLLIAMGAGKLSDLDGYARALAAFALIPPGALPTVAAAWTALELAGGLLLLVGARAGAVAALLSSVGYAVLTTQAYARHLDVRNCTCFGVHLAQRLSWLVLLQDAYMIALSLYVLVAVARRSRRRRPAGSPAR